MQKLTPPNAFRIVEDNRVENIQVFLRMRPPNEHEIKDEILGQESDLPGVKWVVERESITMLQNDLNISASPMKQPLRQSKQGGPSQRTYTFDSCYDEHFNNADIYAESCKEIVLASLKGINGTIFMYGQTGAGKTHTMLGGYSADIQPTQTHRPKTPVRFQKESLQDKQKHKPSKSVLSSHKNSTSTPVRKSRKQRALVSIDKASSTCEEDRPITEYTDIDLKRCDISVKRKKKPEIEKGILIHSLNDLFRQIQMLSSAKVQVAIRCSYFEIYNDQLYDLLDQSDMRLQEQLIVVEDKKKGFVVKGLIEVFVSTFEQCLDLLRLGEQNRSYAQTKMNHHSSRSHTFYKLHMEMTDKGQTTSAVLNFVDLAGSEKASIHETINHASRESSPFNTRAQVQNVLSDRVREGQYINKSLFFLTQVINLKAQKQDDLYIPYRNSPLTKILKSSLGGNSRTAIVLCMTPSVFQIEQTLSTLRFGQNAKKIRNRVHSNVERDDPIKTILTMYQQQLQDTQECTEKMQAQIHSLESENRMLESQLKLPHLMQCSEVLMPSVGVIESSAPIQPYISLIPQGLKQCVYVICQPKDEEIQILKQKLQQLRNQAKIDFDQFNELASELAGTIDSKCELQSQLQDTQLELEQCKEQLQTSIAMNLQQQTHFDQEMKVSSQSLLKYQNDLDEIKSVLTVKTQHNSQMYGELQSAIEQIKGMSQSTVSLQDQLGKCQMSIQELTNMNLALKLQYTETTVLNEDLKMELHREQLSGVRLSSKYEEVKALMKKGEQELARMREQAKENQGIAKRFEIVIDHTVCETTLSQIESMLFKGLQKVNYERGYRASKVLKTIN